LHIFFQKQKNYINNILVFQPSCGIKKKLGWANTPLVLIHFQLSLDATFKQSAVKKTIAIASSVMKTRVLYDYYNTVQML
jgi:hypothetical protein